MTETTLLYGVLALLLIAAAMAVTTKRLLNAVIYAGVLSALAAFVYLLLGAPDVALAEAVIGSTLSTVVFLITLKKYKIFNIRYIPDGNDSRKVKKALEQICKILVRQEIDPHVVHSSGDAKELLEYHDTDILVEQKGGKLIVHSKVHGKYLELLKHSKSLVSLAKVKDDGMGYHGHRQDYHYNRSTGKISFFIAGIFAATVGIAMLWGYAALGSPGDAGLAKMVMEQGTQETGARNVVAAVYLDYRLFDTLLEALLLLVSVIGVSQFSGLTGKERNFPDVNQSPDSHQPSHVMRGSLGPVYFLLAMFGLYVIVTGMDGPGGGFQGGAILAAILITAHFVEGRRVLSFQAAERLEKVMYVLILAAGMLFLIGGTSLSQSSKRIYLVLMNLFIGFKVCAGLSLIYLRFIANRNKEE